LVKFLKRREVAQIDREKEIVAFFRSAFFFVLSLIVALTAYIFNSYEKMGVLKLVLLDAVEMSLIFINIFIGIKLKKAIDKLKEIE